MTELHLEESLPEGYLPIHGILLAKCYTPDGEIVIVDRFTEGLKPWEAMGMLDAARTFRDEQTRVALRDRIYQAERRRAEDDEDGGRGQE